MVEVVKWDGRREKFQREKIAQTLLRVGATPEIAEKISREIEREAYEGIMTKEILDMAFKRLEKHKPAVSLRKDLKTALSEMRSAPEFEEYVRLVLEAYGYEVTPNRVIQGFCVTHEIDGILVRDGETTYLEVKHHSDPHSYTPFDVTLAAKAKWEDINEGFKRGLNTYSFDRVLIVCNTKMTTHAKTYAECVGLDHLGWNVPSGRGFDSLIDEKELYPVTILKSLNVEERDALSRSGVLTLKQLIEKRRMIVDVSKTRVSRLVKEAEGILNLI